MAQWLVRVICRVVLVVCLAPVLLVFAVAYAIHEAWRKVELWAFYNGDESARAKVEAGYR
jgi:hypothetical protein